MCVCVWGGSGKTVWMYIFVRALWLLTNVISKVGHPIIFHIFYFTKTQQYQFSLMMRIHWSDYTLFRLINA